MKFFSFWKISLLVFIIFSHSTLWANYEMEIEEEKANSFVNIDVENISLLHLLKKIEKQSDLNFQYVQTKEIIIKKYKYAGKAELVVEDLQKKLRLNLKRLGNYVIINGGTPILPSPPPVKQSVGRIEGTVIDETGEPMIGVLVFIKGSKKGSITDVMGGFELNGLSPGDYQVVVQFVSYKQQIKAVKVVGDQATTINFKMKPDTKELKEVLVTAKKNRETEEILMMEQKISVKPMQAIGAIEMKRKGASDAEAAVVMLPGISIDGNNKNVTIRGLGDRNNITTLNGFMLPSEEPEFKNIALRFFSSDMLQSISVNKIFSADGPHDVTGGHVDIHSRRLEGKKEFKIDVRGGFNSTALGKEFLMLDGVSSFGFADLQKSFPRTGSGANGFTNSMNPNPIGMPLDKKVAIRGGRRFDLGNGHQFDFYGIGTMEQEFRYIEGIRYSPQRFFTTSHDWKPGMPTYDPDDDFKFGTEGGYFTRSTQDTYHLLMGSVNYEYSNKAGISYNHLYVHSNRAFTQETLGFDKGAEGMHTNDFVMRKQQQNDNTLYTGQLHGYLEPIEGLRLEGGYAGNYVFGEEPDRRSYHLAWYNKEDADINDSYMIASGDGIDNPQRYFHTLKTRDQNIVGNLSYKLPNKHGNVSQLKVGYNKRIVSDEMLANSYTLLLGRSEPFEDLYGDMDYVFEDSRNDVTRTRRTYSVNKRLENIYGEVTYQPLKFLYLNAGLSRDEIEMNVQTNYAIFDAAQLDTVVLIPNVNLRLDLHKNHAIRLGYSKTYTLPQSKEISPFQYEALDYGAVGNPELEIQFNNNYDFKYDYYLSSNEIITFGAFYKKIKNAILRRGLNYQWQSTFTRNDITETYENFDDVEVKGVEVELKKTIAEWGDEHSEKYDRLSFGINLTYLNTSVADTVTRWIETEPHTWKYANRGDQLTGEKKMEGATPIIINSDLSYTMRRGKWELMNTVMFQYTEDKVYALGFVGFENTMEIGVPRLDLISNAKWGNHWGFSLRVRNILNPTMGRYLMGDVQNHDFETNVSTTVDRVRLDTYEYKQGFDFRIGASYTF
ncbi:TonB-dependent receptor [Flammeovirga sp. EKP202]|uniref:TonB-dependent receptor n=1 Tax=Flammeovirga sp. EKP202 TaxID=2770592 RepID=UPI00165F8E76|nr:TonB-dependent receptor [Flammeovirga sp. EKP202]MBD0403943.1 TonB-dependent receptor [Flammeovirga sp. EKP202]